MRIYDVSDAQSVFLTHPVASFALRHLRTPLLASANSRLTFLAKHLAIR